MPDGFTNSKVSLAGENKLRREQREVRSEGNNGTRSHRRILKAIVKVWF